MNFLLTSVFCTGVFGIFFYYRKLLSFIKEYRKGTITYDMIKDYFKFKIRRYITEKTGNGSLISKKDVYELTYYDGDRKYKIIIPKNRSVRQISAVYNSDEICETDNILQTLGPSHNFHGIPTTPSMLGYPNGLKIFYKGGKSKEYRSDEIIQLKI